MAVFHIPKFFERSQGLGLLHGLGVLRMVGTEDGDSPAQQAAHVHRLTEVQTRRPSFSSKAEDESHGGIDEHSGRLLRRPWDGTHLRLGASARPQGKGGRAAAPPGAQTLRCGKAAGGAELRGGCAVRERVPPPPYCHCPRWKSGHPRRGCPTADFGFSRI